jgi:hypothetical protein
MNQFFKQLPVTANHDTLSVFPIRFGCPVQSTLFSKLRILHQTIHRLDERG